MYMNENKHSTIQQVDNTENHRPIQAYLVTSLLGGFVGLMQLVIFVFALMRVGAFVYVNIALHAISILVVIYIINKRYTTAFKLAWCVAILALPLLGGTFYILARSRQTYRKLRKQHDQILLDLVAMQKVACPHTTEECEQPPHLLPFSNRLEQYLAGQHCPPFPEQDAVYYPTGESFYTALLQKLELAEEFIFLEFFILCQGEMWDGILEILQRKAACGVDVRVMWDGFGCLRTLPRNYHKTLSDMGIKPQVFRPFVPFISTIQNNRNHRKIMCIDSRWAFTGGLNISDEYINRFERYGHWKDTGIMVGGEAAAGFTRIFLEMWYMNAPYDENMVHLLTPRLPEVAKSPLCEIMPHGRQRIVPYSDSPLDNETVGKNVYMEMIYSAQKYLYITSPYLIPGNDILYALAQSARSGVDVRLILPHKGDKWYVHVITRSYYAELIEAGVKIYEYTPGFIHSKTFVADDYLSCVGTVNLDYRSLFLHYECGVLAVSENVASQLLCDFEATMEQSTEITLEKARAKGFFPRLFASVMRLFEPML